MLQRFAYVLEGHDLSSLLLALDASAMVIKRQYRLDSVPEESSAQIESENRETALESQKLLDRIGIKKRLDLWPFLGYLTRLAQSAMVRGVFQGFDNRLKLVLTSGGPWTGGTIPPYFLFVYLFLFLTSALFSGYSHASAWRTNDSPLRIPAVLQMSSWFDDNHQVC